MKIITIAFEGPNRSGKGTQIGLLSEFLIKEKVPFIVVRGDGTRTADGSIGNPKSAWWDKINASIHKEKENFLWHLAANRLARELIYWRFKFLPQKNNTLKTNIAFLLIDRSLLSRTMVCVEENERHLSFEDLYPCSLDSNGNLKFDILKIIPDKIFLFSASKNLLISRLNARDPKYYFRRSLIEKKGDWYNRYSKYCPELVLKNVFDIDASLNPDEINNTIINNL